MYQNTNYIYVYIIIICFLIPVSYALVDGDDNQIDDLIISIAMGASSVIDIISDLFLQRTVDDRRNVKRHRKTVNCIFRELGPYYVRRAYRMDEDQFWA